MIALRAITWNIFHGRDFPPEQDMFTIRAQVLGTTLRGRRYAQVTRSLRGEFGDALRALDWDVVLLQEAPPRWLRWLCETLEADGASALTARNTLAALRTFVARRRPDLIGANEGGSNQLLVRRPWRIEEVRRMTIALRPERRRMVWARLAGPDGARVAVSNLHGGTTVANAEREVVSAAERAVEWAGDVPLIFGGDLNLRPAVSPATFAELERRFGLAPPTGPHRIDHLLSRRLEIAEPPQTLPDEVRELERPDGLRVRLSDHVVVAATYRVAGPDA